MCCLFLPERCLGLNVGLPKFRHRHRRPNPPPQDSAQMPLFQSQNILAFHNSQHSPTASIPSRLLSSLRGHANVASSNLTTWASNLLEHLPDSIRELVISQEAKTSGTFDRFSSLNSTATVSTITALLLALFYFAARFLMSTYYRSSFDGYGGGRRSPYASGIPRDMLDHHFEYLTSDSIDDRHTTHHRTSNARPQVPAADPEGAPDVVILKSKGQEYKLHFMPFAISDGLLLVGDLRKYAAEKLNADPKRVRLLYKRVTLEDDRRPATDYGVKQNSTVSCVLAEGGNSAIDSSSDDNIPSSRADHQPRRQQRPRGQSNVRHRSEEQVPVQSSFLHPANAGIPRQTERPAERPTRHDSLRSPTNGDYRRQRSHSRAPSPNPSVATSSSTASIPVFDFKPPKFPSRYDETGPFGKLKALSDTLYNTWLPLCDRYIRHPPSEPKEREKECKRLTESILAKVTLELDNVDLMGINEARIIRKELVECANKVMGRCDERNWEVNPKKEG
jgi:hypothetical protein